MISLPSFTSSLTQLTGGSDLKICSVKFNYYVMPLGDVKVKHDFSVVVGKEKVWVIRKYVLILSDSYSTRHWENNYENTI